MGGQVGRARAPSPSVTFYGKARAGRRAEGGWGGSKGRRRSAGGGRGMGSAAGKRVRRGGPGCAPRAGSTSGGHMGNSRPLYWTQPVSAGGLGAGTVSCPCVFQNLSHWGLWEAECGDCTGVMSLLCSGTGWAGQRLPHKEDSVRHMDRIIVTAVTRPTVPLYCCARAQSSRALLPLPDPVPSSSPERERKVLGCGNGRSPRCAQLLPHLQPRPEVPGGEAGQRPDSSF